MEGRARPNLIVPAVPKAAPPTEESTHESNLGDRRRCRNDGSGRRLRECDNRQQRCARIERTFETGVPCTGRLLASLASSSPPSLLVETWTSPLRLAVIQKVRRAMRRTFSDMPRSRLFHAILAHHNAPVISRRVHSIEAHHSSHAGDARMCDYGGHDLQFSLIGRGLSTPGRRLAIELDAFPPHPSARR